jgi:hypothetical protein
MGNQARRRAEAERAKRRRGITVGLVVVAAAAIAGVMGWRALSGGAPAEAAIQWELADVELEVVLPDDPDASQFQGRGYRVMFDADWRGDAEEPPRRALPCTLTVEDERGNTLTETDFGLFVGGEGVTTTWNPTPIADADLAAIPAAADLSCESHESGAYNVSNLRVVRGWLVTYTAAWAGDGSPQTAACEVRLVGADDPDTSVFDFPVALSEDDDGTPETFAAPVDELTFPPEDGVLDCDLSDDQIIDE